MSSLSASSNVCGNITLDGQPRKGWASRMVAYVPQFDFLLPTLTVAETLRYSALLRLPRDARGHEVQVGMLECHTHSPFPLKLKIRKGAVHLIVVHGYGSTIFAKVDASVSFPGGRDARTHQEAGRLCPCPQ